MAFPIIYLDTAGNGGSTTSSGSTNTASPTVSGTGTASVTGSTVTFTGSPDLSGVSADGSQTIYINDATNSGQKIFRITAVDNTAKTVTVDVAPTGSITVSNWAIGGRTTLPNANLQNSLRAGWELVLNTSITNMSSSFAPGASAIGNLTDGPIIFRSGTPGTQVTLAASSGTTTFSGTATEWVIRDIIFDNTVNSQTTVNYNANTSTFVNCKFTKSSGTGNAAFSMLANNSAYFVGCEFGGGTTTDGYSGTGGGTWIDCYFHDLSGNGLTLTSTSFTANLINCVFDTCAGRGVYSSGALAAVASNLTLVNCTIYGCGNSGLEVADADIRPTIVNCLFLNNGDAAGEYNIEMVSERFGVRRNNVIYHSDAAKNYTGITIHSSEITSDPSLTDPANANFQPGSGSNALAAALSPPGLSSYMDIGAIQRNVIASSGIARVIGG